VVWGRAAGRLSIENSYVDISKAMVTSGPSSIEVDGRFSLGYPRRDGGEEINARIVVKDRPMRAPTPRPTRASRARGTPLG
jgi:hypothetical protein